MRVKTNAGEVELTAEMVRSGMVFTNGIEQFIAGRMVRERAWARADTDLAALDARYR